MKQQLIRLFVSVMDYPDNLNDALARSITGKANCWDKLRLRVAAQIWRKK